MSASELPCVHVRAVLESETLEALRRECDALASCATSYDALDVFEFARALPGDTSNARVEHDAFARARRAARRQIFPAMNEDDTDADIIADALLRKIPLALEKNDDNVRLKELFLFNAHYVVKPPYSTDVFAWHRDGDEQLSLCVDGAASTYVSAWCPLDDVDQTNGCLLFRTNHEDSDEGGGVGVHANAGDIIFFASDVEHASGPNALARSRRVFYAQYSFERLVATASDASPLAFAVPLELSRSARKNQLK